MVICIGSIPSGSPIRWLCHRFKVPRSIRDQFSLAPSFRAGLALILSLSAFIFLRPTPKRHDYQALSRKPSIGSPTSKGTTSGTRSATGHGASARLLSVGIRYNRHWRRPFSWMAMLMYALPFPLPCRNSDDVQLCFDGHQFWAGTGRLFARGFEQGHFHAFLGAGVLIGAQIGAQLSRRVDGDGVSRIMAGGLC